MGIDHDQLVAGLNELYEMELEPVWVVVLHTREALEHKEQLPPWLEQQRETYKEEGP